MGMGCTSGWFAFQLYHRVKYLCVNQVTSCGVASSLSIVTRVNGVRMSNLKNSSRTALSPLVQMMALGERGTSRSSRDRVLNAASQRERYFLLVTNVFDVSFGCGSSGLSSLSYPIPILSSLSYPKRPPNAHEDDSAGCTMPRRPAVLALILLAHLSILFTSKSHSKRGSSLGKISSTCSEYMRRSSLGLGWPCSPNVMAGLRQVSAAVCTPGSAQCWMSAPLGEWTYIVYSSRSCQHHQIQNCSQLSGFDLCHCVVTVPSTSTSGSLRL
mmetsp:Transcript_17505/g.45556  ORF Transcript_17505/g.45556 Transcript_17505/m.45556 type:complete len:270 (-) Transcript_17505:121-930(-)